MERDPGGGKAGGAGWWPKGFVQRVCTKKMEKKVSGAWEGLRGFRGKDMLPYYEADGALLK